MTNRIQDAIEDAHVTIDGVATLNVSVIYMALAQDLDGTLPEGYKVEWGPCSQVNKAAVAQAPAWVWEAATRGDLVLHGHGVADDVTLD